MCEDIFCAVKSANHGGAYLDRFYMKDYFRQLFRRLVKDACPGCGYKFGMSGPSLVTDDKQKWISAKNQRYTCNQCGKVLLRKDSFYERLISSTGFMALFVASAISLWQQANATVALDVLWHSILYLICIVNISISILLGFTRQHFYSADSEE